jgi:hypothetical protein
MEMSSYSAGWRAVLHKVMIQQLVQQKPARFLLPLRKASSVHRQTERYRGLESPMNETPLLSGTV